jgi:hypothetical protein
VSEIIDFLEKIGENAELRYANNERISRLMENTDPALIEAVIRGDQQALESILGARSNVICGVHPADDPDQDDSDEEPANEPNQSHVA